MPELNDLADIHAVDDRAGVETMRTPALDKAGRPACPRMPATLSTADCPSRLLLDQIADKWSVLILAALCHAPLRFNEIKRRLNGVTQKVLTQSLRRLERNGIVERRVLTASPIAVEYRITALGKTLDQPFQALYAWTFDYLPAVERARVAFDQRNDA